MTNWATVWLWPIIAFGRFRRAFGRHWKRILAGAFVGWLYAVVGGAFALASLEYWGLISMHTSDDLGFATVFSGIGLGALIAYAARPTATPQPARVPAEE